MRFSCLGSGSRGNATLVCNGTTRVLIDCGFSRRQLEQRLRHVELSGADVDAVLVTHEHADHVSGARRFCQHYGLPLYCTHGTAQAAGLLDYPGLQIIDAHRRFAVGELQVQPFPVPHDAREPVQFIVAHGSVRLGMLSDTGAVTSLMVDLLSGCDALCLECNHCPEMLNNGPYPPSLKARVASPLGHLSNLQSAQLLARLDRTRLQHLVVTHISEKNNCPDRATRALVEVLGEHPPWLVIAPQDESLAWRSLETA